jgi:hypothetical protein
MQLVTPFDRSNARASRGKKKMSFSLCTLVCRIILLEYSRANVKVRPARMHPQSKGDPVLRLRSRRALSPVPRAENKGGRINDQPEN